MKRATYLSASLFALAIGAAASPASAGFYLEGLQPYTVDYCDEANPALNQPPVTIYDPAKVTPDAAILAGHHAWISSCAKSVPGAHKHRPAAKNWRTAPVPQK